MIILFSLLVILLTIFIIVACCILGFLPIIFSILIFLGSLLIYLAPIIFVIGTIISGIRLGPAFARMLLKRKKGKLYYFLCFTFSTIFTGLIIFWWYIWISIMR